MAGFRWRGRREAFARMVVFTLAVSDVKRGKEAVLRAWRAFLVVGGVVLALFALVVIYGVSQGSLFAG